MTMKLKVGGEGSKKVIESWETVLSSQTPEELLKNLYEHYGKYSKGLTAKEQEYDAKYAGRGVKMLYRRALPTNEGIEQLTFNEAFRNLLIGLEMIEAPESALPIEITAGVARIQRDLIENLSGEGWRVEKPTKGPVLLCGPDVPAYVPRSGGGGIQISSAFRRVTTK